MDRSRRFPQFPQFPLAFCHCRRVNLAGKTLVAETLVAGRGYPKKAWVEAMTPILWS
jgi:hypothetical protein